MRWHKAEFYFQADPPFPTDPHDFLIWLFKQEGARVYGLNVRSPVEPPEEYRTPRLIGKTLGQ